MKPNLRQHQQHIGPELPKLEKVTAKRSRSEPKPANIVKVLRKIALEFRSDRARPFYTVRAVAKRFRIAPATVSRLYRQLSAERLLRPIWGSKTLLEPREVKDKRKRKLQGIGMPVDLVRFTTAAEYQETILAAQRELWNAGVIAHLLFFERSPKEAVAVLSRYHEASIDTVLWISPEPTNAGMLLPPRELGMRVACVAPRRIDGIEECHTIPAGYTIRKIVRERLLTRK
jgi:DNA-binding transcriptional regulator YhcF (GntR family)